MGIFDFLKKSGKVTHASGTGGVSPETEGGGFFFFNWNRSNGAAGMTIDLLATIAPNSSTDMEHYLNAFFEVRFCGIGNNPEMDRMTFTQVQNSKPCLRPGISDAETRLLEGSTDHLGFPGHLLAVWSDSARALPHIHYALSDIPDNGYLGWIPLVGVTTIEQFHAIARELELAFDTCVMAGTYLSGRPWRSFPEGTLEKLGFTRNANAGEQVIQPAREGGKNKIRCPSCDNSLPADAIRCNKCGYRFI